MRLIIDGMGGDKAPEEIVKGVVDAINEYNINITITGNKDAIENELTKYNFNQDKIQILASSDIITNDDDPTFAIRKKKNSSMVMGLKALSEGQGDGFLSAGNTGALLAGGLLIVKRISGIKRAALTSIYPHINGFSLLVDAGANVDCKPDYLEQFALMGSIYMENVVGIKNPKIGLVNIGVEEAKGNILAKESYELLKQLDINFVGNVEGRNLPLGEVDVIVCDGFVGNVILKTTEGVALSLMKQIKESINSNLKTKIGGTLIKSNIRELVKKIDYREYGGAPLLGTKRPIVKAHGSSDAYAIKNAIKQLINFIEKDVISIIEKHIN